MAAIDIKETPSATTFELVTAFDEWLDGLDTPQATLTKHSMEILAKSMRKSMALRDAMLLSVICAGNPEYDKGKLRDYAAAPRIPNLDFPKGALPYACSRAALPGNTEYSAGSRRPRWPDRKPRRCRA